jgi:large subunit ribosomal protein L21
MYAIVRTGGKQYRVERGQRLLIERLPADEGAEVSLEPLLYRSEEAVLDKHGLERVKVTAKVIEHVRGQKLRVFKFKPKRGYRRRTGHRQELTRIEVIEIAKQARKAAAAKPAGAETKPARAETKPASVKATPAGAETRPKAKPQRAAKPAGAGAQSGAKQTKAKPAGAAKAAAGDAGTSKAKAKPARPAKPKEDADGS